MFCLLKLLQVFADGCGGSCLTAAGTPWEETEGASWKQRCPRHSAMEPLDKTVTSKLHSLLTSAQCVVLHVTVLLVNLYGKYVFALHMGGGNSASVVWWWSKQDAITLSDFLHIVIKSINIEILNLFFFAALGIKTTKSEMEDDITQ